MFKISDKDKQIIRDLAKKQFDYSQQSDMKKLKELWYRHNDCIGERAMITIELGTFEQEVVPPLLKCEGELARSIETKILNNFLNHELFKDDKIVPDYISVDNGVWMTLFDHQFEMVKANDADLTGLKVAYQHVHPIEDLERDYHKLKKTTYGSRHEDSLKYKDFLENLLGDILPVKIEMGCLGATPTQKVVHFMGMENMFYSIYDYPDIFKEMMNRIADDHIEYFNWLAEEKLILPTVGFNPLGQGTYCCTNKLPGYEDFKNRSFTSKDVWGYMDSQETVGISPEIFGEFIFPYYKKIADSFGALSYGCCEPVDPIWENYISKFENLRRVSISPWCNEEYMGEQLKGKDIIYHRKPSANMIGVGTTLDEEEVRRSITRTLKAGKGCKIEFTQRDVYSINHDINKVRRYVEIIRELTEKYGY